MSASKLQTSTKQEMFHTLFGDNSFSVKTSQMQTDINQEMLHTLFGDYSYTTKTSVDIDDESITGKPILNCNTFYVRKDKSKSRLIFLRKKNWPLQKIGIWAEDISWAITFCLNHCITLLEAMKPNQVEITTSLKASLIGLCQVQRLWRAILKYKILCFMHVSDHKSKRYLFDDTDNCRFLFTNKDIENLKRDPRVSSHFKFHDPGEISYKSDIHKKSVEWIMNGSSEETPNKMEYICTPLAWPTFKQYAKNIYPKKYAKIRYRFIRNIFVAIEAFWSVKFWYISKNEEDGELFDKIDDVCHVSCFVKQKFDKLS